MTFVTQWSITLGAAGLLAIAGLVIRFVIIPRADKQAAAKDKSWAIEVQPGETVQVSVMMPRASDVPAGGVVDISVVRSQR